MSSCATSLAHITASSRCNIKSHSSSWLHRTPQWSPQYAGNAPLMGLLPASLGRRPFFSFPSPRDLWDEFRDPDRQVASAIITTNVLIYALTAVNRKLFNLLVGNNWLIAKGEWWRLGTAGLLHGGLLHLLGNQLAIHYLSPAMEQEAGRGAFAAIYACGVVGGGLAHFYFGNYGALVLGSSGGIAGIFAAFVTHKLRNRSVVGFSQADRDYIVQMFLVNAALSFLMSGSVAHMAHIGGLVGGAAACWLVGPRYVWQHGRVVNQPFIPLPP